MKSSLSALVQNISGNGKLPIGYTVSKYKDALDSLEKSKEHTSEIRRVMNVERSDFTGVSTSSYDKNGMSINIDQPVWKMNLDVTGSCVVQRGTSYDIVKFPNENEEYATRLGNNKLLPMKLDRNISNNLPNDLKFAVGAFVDLGNLALEYFNKYYVSQGENFTVDKLAKLISSGCVSAQIIFPEKNEFKIVKVIGQTSIPRTATCYITTPLLGTSDWQDCGIFVKIRENNKDKHDFLPTGSTMTFPLSGSQYYSSDGSISDFDSINYKKWVDRADYVYQKNDSILELVKEAPKECYVTLFVPLDKRELAENYLPSGVSDRIFAPYGGKIIRVTSQNAYDGDIEAIFGNVIRKWSSVMLNGGTGSVHYDTSLRPHKLVRGNGGILNSSAEQFSPLFGHNNNLYNYDCSSLITMILCDCDVFRNDVNVITAFTSTTWATTAIEEINSKLKESYKAIFIDIDQNTQICTGDILIITLQERLKMGENRNFGHAALAVVQGGKTHTIEIGSSTEKRQLLTYKPRNDQNYYKHLIRIVKNG